MIRVRWSRHEGYEVSSKGDKRFSALNAILPEGRSIEQIYQLDCKGFDPGGTNWRLGKGKSPLNPDIDLYRAYLDLWKCWTLHNFDLICELNRLAYENNNCLRDRFASTDINQARALAEIPTILRNRS
jgi:hypothetical protein